MLLRLGLRCPGSRPFSTSRAGCEPVTFDSSSRRQKKSLDQSSEPPGGIGPVKLAFTSFESRLKKEAPNGNKTPLVIQHGLLGSRGNWKKVAKDLNSITKRKIVTPDARNHGESPHSPVMSHAVMAADVKTLIKSTDLPGGPLDLVSLMGHGMGGRTAMILALTEPQLVDKLVCVDATPSHDVGASAQRWACLKEACAILVGMEAELRRAEGMERRSVAEAAIQHLISDTRERSLLLTNLICDSSIREAENVKSKEDTTPSPPSHLPPLWRLNLDAILANEALATPFPKFQEAGLEYNGPALFLAGENSKFVRKADRAEIRQLFPRAEFVTIPDCGHWVHIEKREAFVKALVPFLVAK